MPATTLKISGKESVIRPKKEYAALKARTIGKANESAKHGAPRHSKREAADLVEIERRRREPGKKISWQQVKRELRL